MNNSNGGAAGGFIGNAGGSIMADAFKSSNGGRHRKPSRINWRSAGAQGIGGLVGGLAGYFIGGWEGAALDGED